MTTKPDIIRMKQERDIDGLIAALKNQDKRVRRNAAQVLGQIWNVGAIDPLIATLKIVDPLIIALRDKDSVVRDSAIEVLGQIGDARAVEPLTVALKDEDKFVRRSAVKALAKIGGTKSIEPLIAALRDKDRVVCRNAAKTLGQIGHTKAIDSLIAALKDKDPVVSDSAIEVLGQIGDARAVEPLIAALRDEDPVVCHNAAKALGQIGGPAVGPLMAALKDDSQNIQQYAAIALALIGIPDAQIAPDKYNNVRLIIYHPNEATAIKIAQQMRRAGYFDIQIAKSEQEAEQLAQVETPTIRIYPAESDNILSNGTGQGVIGKIWYTDSVKDDWTKSIVDKTWAIYSDKSSLAIRELINDRLEADRISNKIEGLEEKPDKRGKLRQQLHQLSKRYVPDVSGG